jgi:hypothetical protein
LKRFENFFSFIEHSASFIEHSMSFFGHAIGDAKCVFR